MGIIIKRIEPRVLELVGNMLKKIAVYSVLLLFLAAAIAAAYYYYHNYLTVMQPAPVASSTPVEITPVVKPDNSIIAGPVTAISSKSITVKKQDGTFATLALASTTHMVAGLAKGTIVLVIPTDGNLTIAQSVVVVPTPTPPNQ